MERQEELNVIEDSQKKEQRININVRIKESLRDKIKNQMETDNKSPDDFFSDMLLSYLKDTALSKGEIDYSQDLNELNNVIKRVSTIFQNMIEKNYMQTSIYREAHNEELNSLKEQLTHEYEVKLSNLKKEYNKVSKEYNLIVEQAEGLIKDSKELKKNLNILKNSNEKNEELLNTYKEQIQDLKKINADLETTIKDSIHISVLDKNQIENEKKILALEKQHQQEISTLRKEYALLQDKYIKLIESNADSNKKSLN